jgi:acylglycerol lipase
VTTTSRVEKVSSFDGTLLLVRRDLVSDCPAHILLLHGFGEHGGLVNFRFAAERLNQASFSVHTMDLRGHGQSGGERGLVTRWSDLIDDLECVAKTVPKESPLFVGGHSMGSFLSLEFALSRAAKFPRLVGLFGTAPPIGDANLNPVMKQIGLLLAGWLPKLKVPAGLDVAATTRDKQMLKAYLADPDFHQIARAGSLPLFLQAQQNLRRELRHLALPVLLLQGTNDTVALNQSIRDWMAPHHELIWFPDAPHNLLLDTEREVVMENIISWLQRQIGTRS